MAKQNRLATGNRDVLLTMVSLAILCLVMAGAFRMCSFAPGGPKTGEIPEADMPTILKNDARGLGLPLRVPTLPDGWQANTGSRAVLGEQVSSGIGIVVEGDGFIRLLQSAAGKTDIARDIDENARDLTGTADLSGQVWDIYTGEGVRELWITDLGDLRVALLGTVTATEFRELAEIMDAAPRVSLH